MNYPKLSIPLIAVMLFTTAATQAQIVGKSTDTNFYNTTIIYKKGNLNDTDILQKVENDYGMGDVIRIADAPPKPKAEPITQAPQRTTFVNTAAKKVDPITVKTMPAAKPANVVINKPVITPAKEEIKQVKPAAPVVKKVSTTSKSARVLKSKKSGSTKVRFKAPRQSKKHGKQRYSCPKF